MIMEKYVMKYHIMQLERDMAYQEDGTQLENLPVKRITKMESKMAYTKNGTLIIHRVPLIPMGF